MINKILSFLFKKQIAINNNYGLYHGFHKVYLYRWKKLPSGYKWFNKMERK